MLSIVWRCAMSVQIHETPAPTEADARQARETLEQISHYRTFGISELSVRIQNNEQIGTDVILPASALRLLKNIPAEMTQGRAVALLPIQAELTTQQAADLLNVSRPYLIGLLEQRKIPFRLVGQHRRAAPNRRSSCSRAYGLLRRLRLFARKCEPLA
jgi:excisionase family DNA binding protein